VVLVQAGERQRKRMGSWWKGHGGRETKYSRSSSCRPAEWDGDYYPPMRTEATRPLNPLDFIRDGRSRKVDSLSSFIFDPNIGYYSDLRTEETERCRWQVQSKES
jgi:hypothetical protein